MLKKINSAVVQYFDKTLKSLHLRQKYSYICTSEEKMNMCSGLKARLFTF